jgi:hypothetical protein
MELGETPFASQVLVKPRITAQSHALATERFDKAHRFLID